MAVNAATLANVQLSMLQAPEIAREQVPVLAQAQLASAEAPSLIAQHDQEMAESVQKLAATDWARAQDALSGTPQRDLSAYRQGTRRSPRLDEKVVALAGAHPRGIGALVDVSA